MLKNENTRKHAETKTDKNALKNWKILQKMASEKSLTQYRPTPTSTPGQNYFVKTWRNTVSPH